MFWLEGVAMVMFSDSIDKLKREYTDKYVVVDAAQPELARFKDVTGRVKTVNMSGRALVEFDDYHLNIGWYDIDTAFLKVVDKPLPKVEKPKAEKKAPAAKAEAKPAAEKAPAAAKAPAAGGAGKMSVAEMMAAARAGKGGAAAPSKPAEAKPKAEAPAVAKPQAAKPAAPAAGGKMSVAEMLAAARAKDAGGGAAPAAPVAKPQAEAAPVEEAEPVAEAAPPAKAPAPSAGDDTPPRYRVDRTKMSVAEMIAYCRKVDAR